MSTERTRLEESGPHEHLAPEDLLELALEQRAGRLHSNANLLSAQAHVRACSECSLAIDLQIVDLEQVQRALASFTSTDEQCAARVAQATLEATTREDLSWRGDWHVLGRFLRARWSASLAVRLVAASLLLHLLALPVLAIVLVLQVREVRPLWITIQPQEADLPSTETALEPRHELVREENPEPPGPLSNSLDDPLRNDRLMQARRALLAAGAPVLLEHERQLELGEGPARRVARLLIARSQRLGLESPDIAASEPAADSPLVECALWAELLLDDWALDGHADARLSAALARLVQERVVAPQDSGAKTELARHALERAASYGFEIPGLSAGSAPRPALERAWFDALERSSAASWGSGPSRALATWLEWGRRQALRQ